MAALRRVVPVPPAPPPPPPPRAAEGSTGGTQRARSVGRARARELASGACPQTTLLSGDLLSDALSEVQAARDCSPSLLVQLSRSLTPSMAASTAHLPVEEEVREGRSFLTASSHGGCPPQSLGYAFASRFMMESVPKFTLPENGMPAAVAKQVRDGLVRRHLSAAVAARRHLCSC